jgi:dynein regulatory complex protein 1
MANYHALLTARHGLTQDIASISQQNDELKQLLRTYMSSKVNDELCVPPTQILLAQAGLAKQEATESKVKFRA